MKIKGRGWALIVTGLVLGIIFGVLTRKFLWYIPSGIVVGALLAQAFGTERDK
ncbi:MAG: hypothetical protein AB6733_20595 [Clostridiaceae bacterium]